MESKIDELIRKINLLEEELRKEKEINREVLRELSVLRGILTLSSSTYRSSKKIALLSQSLKAGALAKEIVEVLMSEGPLNISQLTNMLKGTRGRASRKTVSKKLEELKKLGVVEITDGRKSEKLFKVKDEEEIR